MAEPTIDRERLRDALQDAWNEWVTDTGCYPNWLRVGVGPLREVVADFSAADAYNFVESVIGFYDRRDDGGLGEGADNGEN